MKALKKYLIKNKECVSLILNKPQHSFTRGTFHKLRVEIKKLNALVDLINFCSETFKRNKTFRPFKQIFDQAGRVREIQVEEAMLKKYFLSNLLKDYRAQLKKIRLRERRVFFTLINNNSSSSLKKYYRKIESSLSGIDKNKIDKYLENKESRIKKLLFQKTVQADQLHELRIRLKKYHYIRKSLGLGKNNLSFPGKVVLPDLLGKWHDCQVIIGHLDKAMDSGNINPNELKQLNKIRTRISFLSRQLFLKIKKAIPGSVLIILNTTLKTGVII